MVLLVVSCMTNPALHGDKPLYGAFRTSQGGFWEEEKVLEHQVTCPACLRVPRFYVEGSSWEVLGVMDADVVPEGPCEMPQGSCSDEESGVGTWIWQSRVGLHWSSMCSTGASSWSPGGLQPQETL